MLTDTQTRRAPAMTIRLADDADLPALWRLAALDSAPAPKGTTYLAETDGVPVAALSSDGRAIGDPFRPTAGLIDTLRAFARAMETAGQKADGIPKIGDCLAAAGGVDHAMSRQNRFESSTAKEGDHA